MKASIKVFLKKKNIWLWKVVAQFFLLQIPHVWRIMYIVYVICHLVRKCIEIKS